MLDKNVDIQNKVIHLYKEEKYSLRKIEKEVDVSRTTIRRILEQENFLNPLK